MNNTNINQEEIQKISDYLHNKMAPAQRSAFEEEMSQDPFLQEAVEGFEEFPGALDKAQQLQVKQGANTKWMYFAVSTLILVSAIIYFIPKNDEVNIIENQNTEVSSLPEDQKIQQEKIENREDSLSTFNVLRSKETDSSFHIAVAGKDEKASGVKLQQNEKFVSVSSIERQDLEKLESIEFDAVEIDPEEEKLKDSYAYFFIEDYKLFQYLTGRDEGLEILKPILNGLPASMETEGSADPLIDLVYEKTPYEEYLRAAVIQLSEQRFNKSHKMFLNILEAYPNDVNASFYAAYCSFRLKKYHRAQEEFYLAKELKNNLFQEESEFHFALSAFENDQKTLARKELEKISEQGGFYAEQANDFLELNF